MSKNNKLLKQIILRVYYQDFKKDHPEHKNNFILIITFIYKKQKSLFSIFNKHH
jgi:hypothetical protein